MTKPIDNPVLKAELWDYASTPQEHDFGSILEFKKLLKQIPQETRTALEELWLINRNESPRYSDPQSFAYTAVDDGRIRFFVPEDLWVTFGRFVEPPDPDNPLDEPEKDLYRLFSADYALAMCKALGIDTDNPIIVNWPKEKPRQPGG